MNNISTYADRILCEEDKLKIEAGDKHLIKFYDRINKIFPEKYTPIGAASERDRPTIIPRSIEEAFHRGEFTNN